jgi:DNA-directed RNA polymerase specialized sigma24 family protein
MESDANQLAEKARCGDRAAAVKLIELFYERIYAFLRRLAANDTDAADLTQRTFTRLLQSGRCLKINTAGMLGISCT